MNAFWQDLVDVKKTDLQKVYHGIYHIKMCPRFTPGDGNQDLVTLNMKANPKGYL